MGSRSAFGPEWRKSLRGSSFVLAVALAAAAATACDDQGITIPGRGFDIEGEIVGVNGCDFEEPCIAVVPEVIESVWIKTDRTDACGIIFSVTEASDLLLRQGSALRRAEPADFTPFRAVRAWARGGVIAESCPAQAEAETIELR